MKTKTKNTVIFDLETQYTFAELNLIDRYEKDPSKLRLAIGGILYEEDGIEVHKFFGENQVQKLIQTLNTADLIITHNGIKFDYQVLQRYTKENIVKMLYDKSFDTMIKLLPFTDGCWTSLDDLCKRNIGIEKPFDGIKVPKLWRDGKFEEVEGYLLNDLRMTKGIYEYINKNGKVKYMHKDYGKEIGEREIVVKW